LTTTKKIAKESLTLWEGLETQRLSVNLDSTVCLHDPIVYILICKSCKVNPLPLMTIDIGMCNIYPLPNCYDSIGTVK